MMVARQRMYGLMNTLAMGSCLPKEGISRNPERHAVMRKLQNTTNKKFVLYFLACAMSKMIMSSVKFTSRILKLANERSHYFFK